MDLNGVPIPKMNWDSQNPLEEFKKFLQHSELIFSGALREKEEEVQVTYLHVLLWLGDRGRETYNTLTLTDRQRMSIKPIADAIQKHLQPKSNPVFSRNKFHKETQADSTTEQFITRLKIIANDCTFDAGYKDDVIRDQIVFGIKSEKVREKLITEGEALTLEKAVRIAQSHEYAQTQLRDMASSSKCVDAVNHKGRLTVKRQEGSHHQTGKTNNYRQKHAVKCGHCGQSHQSKDRCPAKGKSAKTVMNGTISRSCVDQTKKFMKLRLKTVTMTVTVTFA